MRRKQEVSINALKNKGKYTELSNNSPAMPFNRTQIGGFFMLGNKCGNSNIRQKLLHSVKHLPILYITHLPCLSTMHKSAGFFMPGEKGHG
jgi:hypothetical protein